MKYAELYCLSHYSFLRSASSPEELVEAAYSLGYSAIAITDECSVAGMVKAWQASKRYPIQLLVGSEFRHTELGTFLVIAQTRQGYGQLCALITRCRRAAPKGEYQFMPEWLISMGLSECLLVWLPTLDKASEKRPLFAENLRQRFLGRSWLGYIRAFHADDKSQLNNLVTMSHKYNWPLVSCSGARLHTLDRVQLLDVLDAIRLGCVLDQLGMEASRNAELRLRTLEELQQAHPLAWLQETEKVAQLCTFDPASLRYEYPAEVVPEGYSPDDWLRELARLGMQKRFPDGPPGSVVAQVERELQLVQELKYAHFFLTIQDIVEFARQQNILHQGRGSAANSALCYCLGITAVNPTQSDLLFERFISRERNEPPDIDVDFEHERREEVIQYIYKKYGRERAALAATVITYRLRSALRDVGKALGLPEGLISEVITRLDRRDREEGWEQQLTDLGVLKHPRGHYWMTLVSALLGFPRHLSQHVGGFVIAANALHELVPVENASMPDRTVIQWDKDDLEALCLLKVDVLALGMLTAIRKTLNLVQQHHGATLSLATIPQEDPAVYAMLQKADSVGLFQIESRAQMNMLPRLKPATFYDLVVQIAIVRPGPIQGDMVHPYLQRRSGKDAIEYPSDAVQDVLKRTLGVPIFQEQVIKLAMVAAGFTGGEADQLRRAMASWRSKGQLEMFRHKLIDGMLERGYSSEFAERLFAQICGFGEYGFPESHAASFAILAYASAWLKFHYPAAFYIGLLNSLPMGFYSPSQLIQDAKRHQVPILAVCVNQSQWDHQWLEVDGVPGIRLGFRLVKGLQQVDIDRLIRLRPHSGFSVMDELKALALPQSCMTALASANAFAALSGHRYQARWDMTALGTQLPLLAAAEASQGDLQLEAPHPVESMREDYHALGLTLGEHPIALLCRYLPTDLQLPNHRKAEELHQLRHGQIVTVLGVVTGKQRPGTSKGVTFLTLEDDTGNINVVLWQDIGRKQRKQWLHAKLLLVRGTLERTEDVVHVVAGRLQDLSDRLPVDRLKSRDFH